jgi:hypothetical protein
MTKDRYYLDLERISLESLKQRLTTQELMPGRQILKDEIDARFERIAAMGIEHLADLIGALKNKRKVEAFAQASGLPRDYLVILGREAQSYQPKPVYLDRIPGVDAGYVNKLAAAGIRHSKHLFARAHRGGSGRTVRDNGNTGRCAPRVDQAVGPGTDSGPGADLCQAGL